MSQLHLISLPLFASLVGAVRPVAAQEPPTHYTDLLQIRAGPRAPDLTYMLRVDSTDLTGFSVEIRLRSIPDTFRLGMVVHPEYDDRFFRFVEGVNVQGGDRGIATIMREDSTLWRVAGCAGECVVRYRIALPPPREGERQGWVPFLAPNGGLIGGPHAFMYLVGTTLVPARVKLDLPASWTIATGLQPTAEPRSFFAATAFELVDAPILVGRMRRWSFEAGGAPHQVVYWPLPDAVPFDTIALVGNIRRLAEETIRLFGRAPYREFVFQLQDGALGSLEHLNSVSVGAPSRTLAQNPLAVMPELAHEFFHTWNLMRLRPIEYGDVDHRIPPRSRGLWWSEGVTIHYADLLRRRAGIVTFEPTRQAHLQQLLTRYYANAGNARFSAESVSVVAYGSKPGALGDYSVSTHLQGEVLGNMIDFIVRDATDGQRTLDDVLRLMLARFSGRKGFTTSGIAQAVHEVCACPVAGFFDRFVKTAHQIDFDRYLALAGLRHTLTWAPATDDSGRAVPDIRVFAYEPENEKAVRLWLTTPDGSWGRAGLHTTDRLLRINGRPVVSAIEFRQLRNGMKIGDTLRVEVQRFGGTLERTVVITGYDRPVVKVEKAPNAIARARRILEAWERGE